MSFDIFIQCFRDGEIATFKREIVEEIFGPYAVKRGETGGIERVRYPDGGGGDVYYADDEDLNSMMFNHCGGDAFFDALLHFTDRIKGVIYWPGVGVCSVITDAAVLAHLPAGFIDGCGPPAFVHDRDGLTETIKRS
jgi:hypothetical protein